MLTRAPSFHFPFHPLRGLPLMQMLYGTPDEHVAASSLLLHSQQKALPRLPVLGNLKPTNAAPVRVIDDRGDHQAIIMKLE